MHVCHEHRELQESCDGERRHALYVKSKLVWYALLFILWTFPITLKPASYFTDHVTCM